MLVVTNPNIKKQVLPEYESDTDILTALEAVNTLSLDISTELYKLDSCTKGLESICGLEHYVNDTISKDKPLVVDYVNSRLKVVAESLSINSYKEHYIDVTDGNESILNNILSFIKKIFQMIMDAIKSIYKFIANLIKAIGKFFKELLGIEEEESKDKKSKADKVIEKTKQDVKDEKEKSDEHGSDFKKDLNVSIGNLEDNVKNILLTKCKFITVIEDGLTEDGTLTPENLKKAVETIYEVMEHNMSRMFVDKNESILYKQLDMYINNNNNLSRDGNIISVIDELMVILKDLNDPKSEVLGSAKLSLITDEEIGSLPNMLETIITRAGTIEQAINDMSELDIKLKDIYKSSYKSKNPTKDIIGYFPNKLITVERNISKEDLDKVVSEASEIEKMWSSRSEHTIEEYLRKAITVLDTIMVDNKLSYYIEPIEVTDNYDVTIDKNISIEDIRNILSLQQVKKTKHLNNLKLKKKIQENSLEDKLKLLKDKEKTIKHYSIEIENLAKEQILNKDVLTNMTKLIGKTITDINNSLSMIAKMYGETYYISYLKGLDELIASYLELSVRRSVYLEQ